MSASDAASPTDLNNRGVTEAAAGHFEEGTALLRRAIQRDPAYTLAKNNLSAMLADWARLLARQGRIDQAAASLQEAVERDPQNGAAFVQLGDLLYLQRSDLAGAVKAWRQANGHVPAAVWQAVANRISQAQRDQLIERGFIARASAHFDIRFQQSLPVDAAPLEQRLEASYARLAGELGRGLSRVAVLVYTEQDLRRAYNQRDWALGFYDGRIRIRADDLEQDYLADILAHELAHAFLHQAFGGAIPTWVHEGFAQFEERPRPADPETARLEAHLRERTAWIPLKWLDRHFEQPADLGDIARSYAESRLAVRELITRRGLSQFVKFLSALSSGAAVETAYDQAFAPSRWASADQGNFD